MEEKESMYKFARGLRKNMTAAETLLWEELRNRKFNGMKFLRQHPIVYQKSLGIDGFFILDFYCAAKKLALELDGSIHDTQKEYDALRDEILKTLGINVMRIQNEELEDMEALRLKIMNFL
jgi:leucyl-tRNA synthetase